MKNLSVSFAATVTILMVTTIGGVLSARVLLPQGKGELTAIVLWPSMLAAVGSLGIVDAVAYHVAKETTPPSKAFASGLFLAFALAAGLTGIGWIIMPAALSGYGSNVINLARLYLAFIPLSLVTSILMAIMMGKLHLAEFNIVRTMVHVISVLGILMLYSVGHVTVRAIAWAYLIANLVTLVTALAIVWRKHWFGWQPDVQLCKSILTYGLKVQLGSVALWLNLRVDQLLMSIVLDPSRLGLYVVAVTVSAGASLAASTIRLVAFPRVANLERREAKYESIGRFFRLSVVLSIIGATVLFAMTPWILRFFFGPAYLPATSAARILILASIPLACNIILAAGFQAVNRPLVASTAELISLGVTFVTLWKLLPLYQELGAAWASLLAYSVTCIFMIYMLRQEFGMTLSGLFLPTVDDWKHITYQFQILKDRGRGVFKLIHRF